MVSKSVKQTPSVKGSKKSKTVVKTILENPFCLKWPIIEKELIEDVKAQLELCCTGLSIPLCKPPWVEVKKLKGEKRIQYCQQYRKDALEKLLSSPDSAKKYKSAKEGQSHLILGYNAVMRALEQNKLVGILIKKDIQPSFLGQTFLPGCVKKQIPFACLEGLDDILRREELLGKKHSVIALGLKPSVRESGCRFFPLYEAMMKVLHSFEKDSNGMTNISLTENGKATYNEEKAEFTAHSVDTSGNDKENGHGKDVNPNDSDVNQGGSEQNKAILKTHKSEREDNTLKVANVVEFTSEKGDNKDTRKGEDVSKYKLSPEEIKAHHLKRTSSAKRVFVPLSKQTKSDSLEEIVHIRPSKVTKFFSKRQNLNVGPSEITERQNSHDSMELKSSQKDDVSEKPQDMDFQFEFYLDTEADENIVIELEKETKKQTADVKETKKKKGGTAAPDLPYIPAQAKRVKNNPNRETKKVKR